MNKNGIVIILFFLSAIVHGQKFAIISDIHGASANTYNVSVLVKNWYPEFIITAGDNHYGVSTTIDNQVGQFYSDFIFPYSGAYGLGDTSQNNFFPCLGNHDLDGIGLTNYLQYFELPGNERYYDFVRGNVHFFSINSNASEPDGVSDTSIQALWLRDNLANSTSPFNVVYFHLPAYTSGYHGSTLYMRWPFKKWGASIVFSGHDHDYERILVDSFPYIVCGVGGGVLYTTYNPIQGSLFHDFNDHGAILVNANTDSIVFEFRTISDSLIDNYTIYSNRFSINQTNFNKNEMQLFQNYPNPFSSISTIQFYLPNKGKMELEISNIFGEIVNVILCETINAGFHEIKWNVSTISSGIYFYSLKFENKVLVRKAAVLYQ